MLSVGGVHVLVGAQLAEVTRSIDANTSLDVVG